VEHPLALSGLARLATLSTLIVSLGCSSRSSKEFDVGMDGGAGGSAGSSGGSVNQGGAAGNASGGSSAGSSSSPAFPNTPILDDFNRADGALGENWVGSTDFSIVDQKMSCDNCLAATLWQEAFADTQEVYATFAAFSSTSEEINLVLRMQEPSGDCDVIELIYGPETEQARVGFCSGSQWNSLGETHVIIQAGDQFGGRIHEDGRVEVFVNGGRIIDVQPSYPFMTGRIGVSGVSSDMPDVWDDFGGGDWQP
jgi:hypothetical protein